jgi:hypothetical protein
MVIKTRDGAENMKPVQSTNYSGTILRYYFVAGAEIVPPNSLGDRDKKILDGTIFFGVPHVCSHK